MLRNLDHQVLKALKKEQLQDAKLVVAVSGGVDSVALLLSLVKLMNPAQLIAAYVHHGEGNPFSAYRSEAAQFVERLCGELGVEFHPLKLEAGEGAQSEATLREGRYAKLRELCQSAQASCIALGHHADDLLETRLLRLIRGTGPRGLEAMQTRKEDLFRPFLGVSRKDLEEYLLAEEKMTALEDPSNAENDYLRNWLRNVWLPQLEEKVPGSSLAMARSLELIVSELHQKPTEVETHEYVNEQGIQRSYFLTLDPEGQVRCLARYLYLLQIKSFSHSQLEEIKKRLANSQKVHTFKVAGLSWNINAEQIRVDL